MNMNRTIKNDLLPKLQSRYARRNRDGKTRMLDELCENYGCERKYAIKLLRGTVPPPPLRPSPSGARTALHPHRANLARDLAGRQARRRARARSRSQSSVLPAISY